MSKIMLLVLSYIDVQIDSFTMMLTLYDIASGKGTYFNMILLRYWAHTHAVGLTMHLTHRSSQPERRVKRPTQSSFMTLLRRHHLERIRAIQ